MSVVKKEKGKLQDFLRFNLYRLFLITLFFLLFLYLRKSFNFDTFNITGAFLKYITFSYFITLAVVFLITSTHLPTNFTIHFQFISDIVVTSYLIYNTGGAESPFTFLYLLIAFSISFFFPSWINIFYGVITGIIFTLISYFLRFKSEIGISPDITMKIFYIFSAILLFTLLGSFLYSRITKMEKTIEKQAKDLSEVKELYKDIVTNVRSGIIITSLKGTILYSNPSAQKILGMNPLGQSAQSLFGYIPPPERMREEITTEINGKFLIIGLGVAEISIRGEKNLLLTFQDLTKVKKMERELMEKEKFATVGEMASNLAHELRNPLATIKASTQLLLEEMKKGETEKYKKVASILLNESERIEHLIQQLLTFTKTIQLKKERIKIREIINEVFNRTAPAFPERKVSLYVEGNNGIIMGDKFWLEEAFINLFRNSFESMEDDGIIRVRIWEEKNAKHLLLSDSGEGVPYELKEKIFHPFFSTKKGGSGLGLSLTKKIITLHGGEIIWDSHLKGFHIIFKEQEE